MSKQTYHWMNKPWFRILSHLLFWALSYYIFLHEFKAGQDIARGDHVYTILFHAFLVPAVYIHLLWLMPEVAGNQRWIPYLIFSLLLLLIFSILGFTFFEYWSGYIFPQFYFISYFSYRQVLLIFVIYFIVTGLLKLSKGWFTLQEVREKLLESEREKVQIELGALRQQVNPHFFFNTLNSIYSMSIDKDPRLTETILHLSDHMRYFLYEANSGKVKLERELEMLYDYMELQKIRMNEQGQVLKEMRGDPEGMEIAPLLLMTFVENAFKYGARLNPEMAYIHLIIKIEKETLFFNLVNRKEVGNPEKLEQSGGIGLENVSRRLELLYPGRHDLKIQEKEEFFTVALQLQL